MNRYIFEKVCYGNSFNNYNLDEYELFRYIYKHKIRHMGRNDKLYHLNMEMLSYNDNIILIPEHKKVLVKKYVESFGSSFIHKNYNIINNLCKITPKTKPETEWYKNNDLKKKFIYINGLPIDSVNTIKKMSRNKKYLSFDNMIIIVEKEIKYIENILVSMGMYCQDIINIIFSYVYEKNIYESYINIREF